MRPNDANNNDENVPRKVPAEMTAAEKLRDDKEQLKLNLQNFRKTQKTQKTEKQIQKAKKAAALQAQKNSSGLNSTYQAFDLQNYKSPQDCMIGLQSAKKMLQQNTTYQESNTLAMPEVATQCPSGIVQNTAAYVNVAQPISTKVVTRQHYQQQISHQPPPPQARRKRVQHDQRENGGEQSHHHHFGDNSLVHSGQYGGISSQNNQSQMQHFTAGRRQGRFVPQVNTASNQVEFNQNVHPNLVGVQQSKVSSQVANGKIQRSSNVNNRVHDGSQLQVAAAYQEISSDQLSSASLSPYACENTANGAIKHQKGQEKIKNTVNSVAKQYRQLNLEQQEQAESQNQRTSSKCQNQPEGQQPNSSAGKIKQISQASNGLNNNNLIQLDKIATCLNYDIVDQGEIYRLFQQKYNELFESHQEQIASSENAPQEPNLGLLLQLVQNDLMSKQQQAQLHQQQQQQMVQQQQPSDGSNQDTQQVSNNDHQSQTTSEHQLSVSSTVAVMMNNDIDHVGCCDSSPSYQAEGGVVLISDDDEDLEENCDKDDGEQPDYQHMEHEYDVEEDEIDDRCHQHHQLFMGQQSMGCYGGDETEAYEQENLQQQHHHQQPYDMEHHQRQVYHHHQSDYVEAVEGFSPEDEDELIAGADDTIDGQEQQMHHQHHHHILYADVDDENSTLNRQHQQSHQVMSQGKSRIGRRPNVKRMRVIKVGVDEQEEDSYEQEGHLHHLADEQEDQLQDEDEEGAEQYITEEHQYTLNELYAQAHKQLLSNGLGGSIDDIRAWQALYPQLIGGGFTPENLEQMINLGQANLTPQQAQEIFNFQQKQLSEGIIANQKHNEQQSDIDENGNQVSADQQQQYEWCSQESDEQSNYNEDDGEIDETNQQNDIDNQMTVSNHNENSTNCNHNDACEDTDQSMDYQESQNFIHSTLQPPSHLSSRFRRFFAEFEQNIDFILRFDYEILPQQYLKDISKADQKRQKNKYENLLTASRDMCRRFTGPHSVLQIFLEKIVASIKFIAERLKEETIKDFDLWTQLQIPITDSQQIQYKQTNSSAVLVGHKRSSSANPELLITKTSKTSENQEQTEASKESQQIHSNKQQQLFATQLKPKPLLKFIDNYTGFLALLRSHYYFIMKNCAPKISKHFTKLTAVIVENTQYEFPSTEIHKAVISKLILNDQNFFKQLVQHMQHSFTADETYIRENHDDFVQALELFLREVDDDMRANQTKIDIYMRDLRKHALDEYEDLYRDEQELVKQGGNADGKKKRKKRKKPKNKNVNNPEEDGEDTVEESKGGSANQHESTKAVEGETIVEDYQDDNDIQDCGIDSQEIDENPYDSNQQSNDQDIYLTEEQNQCKKKKRKNRRKKKKKQDNLTNELLNNLDTDDLVDFINNCGSKKDDLKKQGGIQTQAFQNEANQTDVVDEQQEINDCYQNHQDQGLDENKKTETSAVIAPQEKVHLSRKQRKELYKKEVEKVKAARMDQRERVELEGDSDFRQENEKIPLDSAQNINGEISQMQYDTQRLQDERQTNNDENDSDLAFEDQLSMYRESLTFVNQCLDEDNQLMRQRRKMRPNVTKVWLNSVRGRLHRLEEESRLLAQKRAFSSYAK